MATASIIKIEVQDGEFKSFVDRFQKYRDTLAKLPAQWGAVGKAISGSANVTAKFVAQTSAIAKQFKAAESFAGKLTIALKTADRLATSLGRGSLTFARNIKDATTSLLKWGSLTGLISGLLGAGGLFGIARLAQSVSGGQQSAKESGSTYGETKGAIAAYGQMLGGEGGVLSVLSKINEARQSFGMLGGKHLFLGAGMKNEEWRGKTSAEILPAFLAASQKNWARYAQATGGQGQAMIAQHGAEGDVFTVGQRTAMAGTDLSKLAAVAKAVQKQTEISAGTQDTWANFNRTLGAAGEKIEAVFIRALTPLIPSLSKFSDAIGRAISTIMENPNMKGWIKKTGEGVEAAAKWLTSPAFGEAVSSFMDAIDKIAGALFDVAKFVGNLFGSGLSLSQQKRADKFGAVSQIYAEEYREAEKDKAAGNDYGASVHENTMKSILQGMPGDRQRKIAAASSGESFVTGDLVQVLKKLDSHLTSRVDSDKHIIISGVAGTDIPAQTAAARH